MGGRDERVQERLDRRPRRPGRARSAQVLDHRGVVHRVALRSGRSSSRRSGGKPAGDRREVGAGALDPEHPHLSPGVVERVPFADVLPPPWLATARSAPSRFERYTSASAGRAAPRVVPAVRGAGIPRRRRRARSRAHPAPLVVAGDSSAQVARPHGRCSRRAGSATITATPASRQEATSSAGALASVTTPAMSSAARTTAARCGATSSRRGSRRPARTRRPSPA